MELDLADRAYLVTGGSRGIGREVAAALAAEGATVASCGRDGAACEAASSRSSPPSPAATRPAPRSEAPRSRTCGTWHRRGRCQVPHALVRAPRRPRPPEPSAP